LPKNSDVHKCFEKLTKKYGVESAAKICQKSTGHSLKTGKAPKKKK